MTLLERHRTLCVCSKLGPNFYLFSFFLFEVTLLLHRTLSVCSKLGSFYSIRQHTYLLYSIRQHTCLLGVEEGRRIAYVSIRLHTYSIRQHTYADGGATYSIRQHTSAYV